MEAHQIVGALFSIAAIEHLGMILTIIISRVMRPPGRALVSAYLALNGLVYAVIGIQQLASPGMREDVALAISLGVALALLSGALLVYGLVRAIQGARR